MLEVSAGTGRNLPHYRYDNMSSLTLVDVSAPMLQRAEEKCFDELRLNYAHPKTRLRFFVADGHCLTAPPGVGCCELQTWCYMLSVKALGRLIRWQLPRPRGSSSKGRYLWRCHAELTVTQAV